MRPLAIIESDAPFALQLLRAVESARFRAAIFPFAKPALPLLRERLFALTLLDLYIADADALEICRETSPLVPTIVVTRAGDPQELCASALDAGADDCICHDVGARELVARVRNVLRRAELPFESHDRMAAAVSEMRVHLDDRVENLTRGETAVLAALLDRAPTPMTTEEIGRAVGATRGTVESQIKSLRRKIGPERLVSRGRFGYQIE